MSITTRWFSNEMAGAPELTNNAAGSFISVLDACLCDGFNLAAVDGLAYDSGTKLCTLTVNAGHGFERHQVISISGASEPGYNGDHIVVDVVSPTELTYAPVSAPTAPAATGSIMAKAAPLGWEKVFSDTNRAVYRAPNGNRHYLRVDDSDQWHAIPMAADTMADIDTATFWSRSSAFWRRNRYGSETQQNRFILVGNDRFFYLSLWDYDTNGYREGNTVGFGDYVSYLSNDSTQTVLIAEHDWYQNDARGNRGCITRSSSNGWAFDLFRDHAGGGAQVAKTSIQNMDLQNPNPVDNKIHILKTGFVIEDDPNSSLPLLRGVLPQLYVGLNLFDLDFGSIIETPGRVFVPLRGRENSIAVEIGVEWEAI